MIHGRSFFTTAVFCTRSGRAPTRGAPALDRRPVTPGPRPFLAPRVRHGSNHPAAPGPSGLLWRSPRHSRPSHSGARRGKLRSEATGLLADARKGRSQKKENPGRGLFRGFLRFWRPSRLAADPTRSSRRSPRPCRILFGREFASWLRCSMKPTLTSPGEHELSELPAELAMFIL